MTGTVTVTGTAGQESAGESGPRPPEHRHGDSDSHGGTVRVTGTVTIARGRNATGARRARAPPLGVPGPASRLTGNEPWLSLRRPGLPVSHGSVN